MEKLEKFLLWSLIVAIVMFSIGIISGTINQFVWLNHIIDTLSLYLIVVAIIPFLVFQFLYSANFDLYGTGNMKLLKIFFYLFVFPTIDIIFVCSFNILYQIIPSFDGIIDPIEFESARISAAQHLIFCWASMYLIIFIAGKIFYGARALYYLKCYLNTTD